MLNILLIVFSILMVIISIGMIIGGLVKKNRKLLIVSLSSLVIFILLTVFSIANSIKRTVDYMGTEEFQTEAKEKAENLGKTWGNTVSGTAKGLNETLDEEEILKLANKSSKIVGEGIKIVAAGFDETIGKTKIFSDESIDKAGILVGRAERIKDSLTHSFGLFLEFNSDFDGELVLTAYDNEGLKMDISEIDLKEKAGQAKVCVFQFKYFEPGLSGYCILKNK